MQKQRLEMEDAMARKLREKEDVMTRQTNSSLQQKEDAIEGIVKSTKESLEAEHEAALVSAEERLTTEIAAKYEVQSSKQLSEEKQKFLNELNRNTSVIEELGRKLKEMESALAASKSFESGSLQAHRVSAAALALSEKIGSDGKGESATAELRALEAEAHDNGVISAAIKSIPSLKEGIPTLSELQSRFELVHGKVRQAALVPEGRSGLEGQLVGMALSSVKFAPNPDDPAPEDMKDSPEYCLARARKYVQLGELERAVQEVNQLKGQASFTIQDWKESAMNRVALDRALRIIKMECAMLNKSIGSGRD